jgi:hypothetical protein
MLPGLLGRQAAGVAHARGGKATRPDRVILASVSYAVNPHRRSRVDTLREAITGAADRGGGAVAYIGRRRPAPARKPSRGRVSVIGLALSAGRAGPGGMAGQARRQRTALLGHARSGLWWRIMVPGNHLR